jgi:hypothetical protein
VNQPAGTPAACESFWVHVFAEVRHTLPILLLLVLATAALHKLHLLDELEGWFMRQVVRSVIANAYAGSDVLVELPDQHQRIQVVEAGPLMRITELEHDGRDLDAGTLDRIGGVRPIDRVKMAELLNSLADQIKQAKKASAGVGPGIVVIDVDIAPLKGPRQDEMRKALMALREHVHVVAIVLDRPTPQARIDRNVFMTHVAQCTQYADQALLAGPAAPKGLFFASPRLFYKAHGYPMQFPHRAKADGAESDFPSVSTLIRILSDPGAIDQTRNQHTLTRLCREAAAPCHQDCTAPLGDHLLLEDRLAGYGELECPESKAWSKYLAAPLMRLLANNDRKGCSIEDLFEVERINWKLHGLGLVESHLLAPRSASPSASASANGGQVALTSVALAPGTLLLGIDGGARHDKFDGATFLPEYISGSHMHALQALSLVDDRPAPKGYKLDDNHTLGFLVDVVVGLLFVVPWAICKTVSKCAKSRWPHADSLIDTVTALMPPTLALVLGVFSVKLAAPWLLAEFNTWANPAYVLAGLVAHAYVEAWKAHDPAPSHRTGLHTGARTRARTGVRTRLPRDMSRKSSHGTSRVDFSFGCVEAWRGRRCVDLILPVLGLLICALGIASLVALPGRSGFAAAVLSAFLIGYSMWTAWWTRRET